MLILGIESSCDETAVAVLQDLRILANVVSSQLAAHQPFGGVVPELAARMHLEALRPLIGQALAESGLELNMIDLVCATRGPGLVGALLVGFSAAKALAYGLGKPFVAVNHVAAHIYANFLREPPPEPPYICLTVSGGHTDLLLGDSGGRLELIGATRDDAAGECLDKTARVLGLGYPGGPAIEKEAAGGRAGIPLPRPIIAGTLDFSFSGLKTAVVNMSHRLIQGGQELPRADLAASIQRCVIDGLLEQLSAAAEKYGAQTILLSGGVAANTLLREEAAKLALSRGASFFVPPKELCTDNAAMVACAGYLHYMKHGSDPLNTGVDPDLRIR